MLSRLAIALLASCTLAGAAEVRITGLHTIKESTVRELLAARLEFIESRPASLSRANDAAFYLAGVLRRQGYDDPGVRAEVRPPDLIVLEVTEGPRSMLGEVQVQGVDAEVGAQLARQFELAHRGKVRRLLERAPYIQARSAEGVANAASLLKSKGYWEAHVTLAAVDRNPATGLTGVLLVVEPGLLHHLSPPQISSGGIAEETVAERLSGLVGEVADTKNINRARKRVNRIFQDAGYHEATVEMRARHSGGLTELRFVIVPGRRFTVGSFAVTGEEATKPHRIANRFRGVEGAIYDFDLVTDRIRKLYATGAFRKLQLDESLRADGVVDLTLRVVEEDPDNYFFWAGGGSYEGFLLGAGYYHRNLFGNLWNYITGVEVSGLGLRGFARLTDPFFLESDLRFTGRAFILSRTFEGWEKVEAGIGAEIDWPRTDHYSLRFHAAASYVETSSDGIPRAALGPDAYLLGTLGVTQIYDRRDDPVLPTKGYYAKLTTEVGVASDEESTAFFRAHGGVAGYIPVTPRATLALTAQAGVIIPGVDPLELPIDLRFFTGGASSVRSFPEREMGPMSSNGDPIGGEAYWVANLEYIHRVAGPLHGVAFLDAGSLSPDYADWGAADVEMAVGLGIWLGLPVGPIRLEYGRSLTRDPGDPSGALHFAIRTTF